MKKNNLPIFSRWVFFSLAAAVFTIGAVSLAMNSSTPNALANSGGGETVVRGTVDNIIIVQTPDGIIVKILELNDGKKYRLGKGVTADIGKGFNVELVVPDKFEPVRDEVSAVHTNAIPVIAVEVTAIPIPGSSDKLVYPSGGPPQVIEKR